MLHQITVKNLQKPMAKDPEEDVNWICESLAFSTGRDLEQVSSRMIIKLLEVLSNEGKSSSEEIADELAITPARVNYHVRNLIDSGFLYREKRLIFLRAGSVKAAIEEMRKDVNRIFDELTVIGEDIDNSLGLKNRV